MFAHDEEEMLVENVKYNECSKEIQVHKIDSVRFAHVVTFVRVLEPADHQPFCNLLQLVTAMQA